MWRQLAQRTTGPRLVLGLHLQEETVYFPRYCAGVWVGCVVMGRKMWAGEGSSIVCGVDLLNGPQDHGWCSGYTCRKRLSTVSAVVRLSRCLGWTCSSGAGRE